MMCWPHWVGVCITLLFFVALRIKGMQHETKDGDTIFFLPFFSVLCMKVSCAKFEKNLDSTSFSSELP